MGFNFQYVIQQPQLYLFLSMNKNIRNYLSIQDNSYRRKKYWLLYPSGKHSMGRKSLVKNNQNWLRSTWYYYFPIYGQWQGILTHNIFLTHFLYLFWNGPPHSWNKMTQFNSKIVRCVHICSTVYAHDHNSHFL